MKCSGKFKFKTIDKRDGGKFLNANGQEITFKESYALKVDEILDDSIHERVFKLPIDSNLVKPLKELKPYTDIIIDFDVIIYNNKIVITPTTIRN